jgi:hypothetical protein
MGREGVRGGEKGGDGFVEIASPPKADRNDSISITTLPLLA